MISAPYLEVSVIVLGTVILLVESFASQLDRRFLGYAALFGLAIWNRMFHVGGKF